MKTIIKLTVFLIFAAAPLLAAPKSNIWIEIHKDYSTPELDSLLDNAAKEFDWLNREGIASYRTRVVRGKESKKLGKRIANTEFVSIQPDLPALAQLNLEKRNSIGPDFESTGEATVYVILNENNKYSLLVNGTKNERTAFQVAKMLEYILKKSKLPAGNYRARLEGFSNPKRHLTSTVLIKQ